MSHAGFRSGRRLQYSAAAGLDLVRRREGEGFLWFVAGHCDHAGGTKSVTSARKEIISITTN
jgi:hypothetical protein